MSEEKKKKSTKKKATPKEVKEENQDMDQSFFEDEKEEKKEKPKIDTGELNQLISLELDDHPHKEKKGTPFLPILIVMILVGIAVFSFGMNLMDPNASIMGILQELLLSVFIILFGGIVVISHRKDKKMMYLGSLVLILFMGLHLNNTFSFIQSPFPTTPYFVGESITEVVDWASKNSIVVNQEYEFSDMIPEYKVISQDVEAGTSLKKVKEITVSVSEGPNPSKEIMVPNMISWDAERVLAFIKENYLSNVLVEFIQSEKQKDTVIEQSASGSLKRDDEIKFIFSYGPELSTEDVKLMDFKNKSEFEVEFYMKQHQLKYKFERAFDKKIKKGYAISQSIEPGEMVKVNDTEIVVTISKGPEIKVPDLTKYDMTEITKWAIENKLKLNFSDAYDDTVKEHHVVSANFKEGDIIEQGTIVKVVLSKGPLKMEKFDSLTEFMTWAEKYNVKYEERHEFSETVPAGEIISFSYDAGKAIKNNDSIVVVISDGAKKTVPNVVGLSKNDASSKISKAGLRVNFIYRYNNNVAEGKVVSQSISAGSEVSSGTTITVTISNGPQPVTPPTPPTPPVNTCTEVTVYLYPNLLSSGNAATTCSNIKAAYSNLKFNCNYVCDQSNGLVQNSEAIHRKTFTTCDTITLNITDTSKCQ